MKRLCSIEGCGRKHVARGFCQSHYGRFRIYGDPGVDKSRPLIEFNGLAKSITDWAKEMDITATSLSERIRAGWPIERALTEKRGRFGPQQKSAVAG